MRIIELHDAATTVLKVVGEIDPTNADDIANRVSDALGGGPTLVIMDLSDVTFMDSTGLSALLRARAICQAGNVEMMLRDPTRQVLKILELTSTHHLFEIDWTAPAG